MKKLNKISIHSEKRINNSDLIFLKGGDAHCMCYSRDPIPQPMGLMAATNQSDCDEFCGDLGWDGMWNNLY